MPSRQTIPYSHGVFFITFTCYRWLHILEHAHAYDVVYNWFDYLKLKGHYLNAYVLMPNHVHAIISFISDSKSLNTVIGNGKRFMAYGIIKKLKDNKDDKLLELLSDSVSTKDKLRKKQHEVWELSFDWKDCLSNSFVDQKINYIHNNPCSGKWNLSPTPTDYVHSSARFYEEGVQGIYAVTNISEMEDVDFNKRNVPYGRHC